MVLFIWVCLLSYTGQWPVPCCRRPGHFHLSCAFCESCHNFAIISEQFFVGFFCFVLFWFFLFFLGGGGGGGRCAVTSG